MHGCPHGFALLNTVAVAAPWIAALRARRTQIDEGDLQDAMENMLHVRTGAAC